MRSYEGAWASNPIWLVSLWKKCVDTDMHTGRLSCEDDSQGDVFTRQGTLRTASKSVEAGREEWDPFSLKALRSNQPCGHLDLRLLVSRTVKQFLLFKPCSLWHLLWQPLETNTCRHHPDLSSNVTSSREFSLTPSKWTWSHNTLLLFLYGIHQTCLHDSLYWFLSPRLVHQIDQHMYMISFPCITVFEALIPTWNDHNHLFTSLFITCFSLHRA